MVERKDDVMSNGVLLLRHVAEPPPEYDARALQVSPDHLQLIAELLAEARAGIGAFWLEATWHGAALTNLDMGGQDFSLSAPAGSYLILVNGEHSFRVYEDLSSVPNEWQIIS